MNWKEMLTGGVHYNYAGTDALMAMVTDDELDWKPATGSNWMTMGQLLKHITESCGMCFKGFVTGDWGMPEGMDASDLSPEEMLPPAEKLPTVESVAQARKLLAEDKKVALAMLAETPEEELDTRLASAPWDKMDMVLGQRLLQMLEHLMSHKSQLFYYLKLQGKPVHTGHLWGAG